MNLRQAKEHFKINKRINEIKATQVTCKNGKLEFHPLTPEAEAELATLEDRLADTLDKHERNLFEPAEECKPEAQEQLRNEVFDMIRRLPKGALAAILDRIVLTNQNPIGA